jgi:hypothetical protein
MFVPVHGAHIPDNGEFQGGFRRTGGHSGIDFAAPAGSLARAAVPGVVVSTGWAGAYGNLVKVRHDDGSIGYYAHLSAFSVRPGQRVGRGSTIGRVGSTGNSTGPHLHFEVRQNGKPVDPRSYLGDDFQAVSRRLTGRDVPGLAEAFRSVPQLPPLRRLDGTTVEPQGPIAGSLTDTPERAHGEPGDDNPLSLENVLGREAQLVSTGAGLAPDPPQAAPGSPVFGQTTTVSGGTALERLLRAIGVQESGNDYSAVNRDSGALGKYQIMPANVAPWSRAALGYTVSRQQFLRNPNIQEQIARHRLNQYLTKYGPSGAALAWYAGEGALRYSPATRNRAQGRYPSMNEYVNSVLRKAGLM